MTNIYINIPHTKYSIGACYYDRNEYKDTMKFARILSSQLNCIENVHCEIYTGRIKNNHNINDIILILHRGCNKKNSNTYGAEIYTKSNSTAKLQYYSYLLLKSICIPFGFRMKAVHVNHKKSPFQNMETSLSENTFLLILGYMDSKKDNELLDEHSLCLAKNLVLCIKNNLIEDTCNYN